jgi:hypothetical protein
MNSVPAYTRRTTMDKMGMIDPDLTPEEEDGPTTEPRQLNKKASVSQLENHVSKRVSDAAKDAKTKANKK